MLINLQHRATLIVYGKPHVSPRVEGPFVCLIYTYDVLGLLSHGVSRAICQPGSIGMLTHLGLSAESAFALMGLNHVSQTEET
jgi:hypothetical protein